MGLRVNSPSADSRVAPFALTLLLCLAWLLPGLVGHAPWKGSEAQTMGLVHSILSGAPAWLPTLGGEPWAHAAPPLYPLVAALFAQLVSPWLPVHDGARLAAGMFILLVMLFSAWTGRELYGHRHGRLVVLTLVGSIGLWVAAHESIPQSAELCGVALFGYGMALMLRRTWLGSVLAGTGIGICFMASGVLETLALFLTLLALPVAGSAWRTRRFWLALPLIVLAASPWLIWWPWQAWHAAPDWFAHWWQLQRQQLVFWAAAPVYPSGYYFEFLPWFAWPAWPLALWTLWQSRRNWGVPGVIFPLVMWLCNTLVLSCDVKPDPVSGLPLLLPLAWLAAGGSASLRRGAANALYWFAMMTFGVLALAVWVYWSALDLGYPVDLARHLHALQPLYQGHFHLRPVLLATLYCVAWLAMLTRMKRAIHRPLLVWAAGMTLAWGLAAFLFVRPIDARLSYAPMMSDLNRYLPQNSCVASRGLGAGMRGMLDYYLGLQTLRETSVGERTCRFMLVEYGDDEADIPAVGGWSVVWHGQRMGNHVERYVLYRRD